MEDVGIEGGVADDLLQLKFHTDYVGNPEKRCRRWKLHWEALLHAACLTPLLGLNYFHALERETDTTLVLLSVPSHTGKLHSVALRAIHCDNSLIESSDMMNIHSTFAGMAARRCALHSSSLIKQLVHTSSSSCDGSPSSSSNAREEDLHRALDTAISSLHTLGSPYERWEMHRIEEKHRLDEDKEKVQLLLKQVLGVGVIGNLVDTSL
ncbi:hypothetical protein EDB92DRAFT_1977530 [Lactarius akahatsu]|uniref:Uncharacterized protein n=1 Tax=Lactarius akahatsu TaxID=416441 RepID=A0AAD4L4D9_9AGAM|nr:hypothetical protein EDB92DRAFT_1977530 [Lactarius akahatsu]